MVKVLLWIWQLPQNLVGAVMSLFGKKEVIDIDGKNVNVYMYKENGLMRSAVSLGDYIIMDGVHKKLPKESMLVDIRHEYGHSRQSKYLGPLYLIVIGLPSLIGNIISRLFHKTNEWYYKQPWEKWADTLGNVKRDFS